MAIARSLVNRPSLILADEPTGNLDTRTSIEIMAIFQRLNREGISVVLVTHEPDIAHFTMRTVMFRDGRIVKDEPNSEFGGRNLAAQSGRKRRTDSWHDPKPPAGYGHVPREAA